MKITFIKDVGPNYFTGWSVYYTGEKADLRHGHSIVADGSARDGWEAVKQAEPVQVSKHIASVDEATSERPSAPTVTVVADVPSYTSMSVAKVRAAAKDANVWRRGMKKSDMIAAMENQE